ncbi:hypothetical protein SCG7086_CD_00020 [Chlamydiales bacterium SCGC AG-110-P3]|nr:hypothetical protein SCG7086_CD_00020 [Chlamydiales bacterium SCGC AG-110-P3]
MLNCSNYTKCYKSLFSVLSSNCSSKDVSEYRESKDKTAVTTNSTVFKRFSSEASTEAPMPLNTIHKKRLKGTDLKASRAAHPLKPLNENTPRDRSTPSKRKRRNSTQDEQSQAKRPRKSSVKGLNQEQNLAFSQVDQNGCTALTRAVIDNDLEQVLELMTNGADINSPDANGKTAMDYATAKVDLEQPIDLDDDLTDNVTPYKLAHLGAIPSDHSAGEFLISLGVSVIEERPPNHEKILEKIHDLGAGYAVREENLTKLLSHVFHLHGTGETSNRSFDLESAWASSGWFSHMAEGT